MVAIRERNPFGYFGRPDVLGILGSGHRIEVEIKRTMSDFRANAKKWHVVGRENLLRKWPRNFYFCVPGELLERVQVELPDYAGLLYQNDFDLAVAKIAPTNNSAEKISLKTLPKLARCVGNQIYASERKAFGQMQWRIQNDKWMAGDYEI